MRLYRPIRTWADLPTTSPAVAAESLALDYKTTHTRDSSEHAKDIAAFANALGGVVLIGVPEKADSFSRKLIPVANAEAIARDYEDAARDLLAPRPTIEPCVVRYPQNDSLALVAVNVDPFKGQLVGARLPDTKAWRFPIRTVARHCAYVDPEKFMLYSDASSRKAAVLLLSIPEPERKSVYVQLKLRRDLQDGFTHTEKLYASELLPVNIETNTVTFSVTLDDDSGRTIRILRLDAPLEDVEAVWKGHPGWFIRLAGSVQADYRIYLSGRP